MSLVYDIIVLDFKSSFSVSTVWLLSNPVKGCFKPRAWPNSWSSTLIPSASLYLNLLFVVTGILVWLGPIQENPIVYPSLKSAENNSKLACSELFISLNSIPVMQLK